ncbi:MAG TPA: hypothetical protein VLI67_04215 [Vicinamibacteria bacterium]|nr:hypothetical protein [Vicinamibacteria bacterium]
MTDGPMRDGPMTDGPMTDGPTRDGPGAVGEVLARAREALRAVAHERRDAALAQAAAEKDAARVVGAAVEALETLEDTVGAYLDQLEPAARDAVRAAAESAWQGLEAAGVARDGAVGERVDLSRHRVVGRREVEDRPAPGGARVLEVVAPGIVFRGSRVRPAVVVAGAPREGGDAAGRD